MPLIEYVPGRIVMGAILLVAVGPVALFGMASDRLVAMGLPRTVAGPIAAVLMVVWAIAVLAFVAM